MTAWWASESPLLIVLDNWRSRLAMRGIAVMGSIAVADNNIPVGLIGPTYRQQEASAIDEQREPVLIRGHTVECLSASVTLACSYKSVAARKLRMADS